MRLKMPKEIVIARAVVVVVGLFMVLIALTTCHSRVAAMAF